jgi:hypothetical protein
LIRQGGWLLVAVLAIAAGCGDPLPLQNRLCPCLAGYQCCSGQCILEGERCLESADARPDGPSVDRVQDAPVAGDDAGMLDGGTDAPADAPGEARPGCGMGGQACCPGNACEGGGCCLKGICVAVGHACSPGSSCFFGSCGGAGGLQQPCWQGSCTESRTICLGGPPGVCETCGGPGQPCCEDGFCAERPGAGRDGGDAPADAACNCRQDSPETCGYTGACDDRGICLRHPAGTVCKLASCQSEEHMIPESVCDGQGSCLVSQPISCRPTRCQAGSCLTTCGGDGDCISPAVCRQGSCGSPGNHQDCTQPNQCASGNCVEGVCCDRACTSPCETCALPNSRGRCSPRPAASGPDGGCATDAGAD